MKKIVLFILLLILLVGCQNKNNQEEKKSTNTETFVVEKIDDSKDYVHLQKYQELKLDGNDYSLDILVINIKGDDIDNVNLELKSFVTKSYQNMEIYNSEISQGNIISYEYYKTDKYLSVLQKYYAYVDGIVGEENVNFYNISLDNGKVLNNNLILESFKITEEELLEKLENGIVSEDISYTMMNIKKDGYDLYIDNNGNLVVSYYEIDNENCQRKEWTLEINKLA
ncbi:MAG: hypothetical protein ACI4XM_06730 [Candidatus Coprovivens sp.]